MRNRPRLTTPHSAKWIHATIGLVALTAIVSGLYKKDQMNHKAELPASVISQKAFALCKAFTGYEAPSADLNRIQSNVLAYEKQTRPCVWWGAVCQTGSWKFDMLFNAQTGRIRYLTGAHVSAGLQKLGPQIKTPEMASAYGLRRMQEMDMIPLHAHAVLDATPVELPKMDCWRLTYRVKRPDYPKMYLVRTTISRQNGIPLFAEDMSEMVLSATD